MVGEHAVYRTGNKGTRMSTWAPSKKLLLCKLQQSLSLCCIAHSRIKGRKPFCTNALHRSLESWLGITAFKRESFSFGSSQVHSQVYSTYLGYVLRFGLSQKRIKSERWPLTHILLYSAQRNCSFRKTLKWALELHLEKNRTVLNPPKMPYIFDESIRLGLHTALVKLAGTLMEENVMQQNGISIIAIGKRSTSANTEHLILLVE